MTVTEKGKILVGHWQLPKGWWGQVEGLVGKFPPSILYGKNCTGNYTKQTSTDGRKQPAHSRCNIHPLRRLSADGFLVTTQHNWQ